MNKIMLLGFLLTIILAACNDDFYKKPTDLIPPEKMELILEDIHLGDAILSDQRSLAMDLKSKSKRYYGSIYKKYDITRKQFDESMKYYTSKPAELEKIYEAVTASIARKEKLLIEEDRKKQ